MTRKIQSDKNVNVYHNKPIHFIGKYSTLKTWEDRFQPTFLCKNIFL